MTRRPHRRYSTEFKLQLAQSYLDGEGSLRTIAKKHGVGHSVLRIWVEKYERGELAEEVKLQEKVRDYELTIARLERKVGQLTMELDLVKKTLAHRTPPPNGTPSIISGPSESASRGDAAS